MSPCDTASLRGRLSRRAEAPCASRYTSQSSSEEFLVTSGPWYTLRVTARSVCGRFVRYVQPLIHLPFCLDNAILAWFSGSSASCPFLTISESEDGKLVRPDIAQKR